MVKETNQDDAATRPDAEVSSHRQIEELLLLQRVTRKIASILDHNRLLEEVVEDVASTFGYQRTAILLRDGDSDDLVAAACRDWARVDQAQQRFRIGRDGIVGRVAESGEAIYAPDVRENAWYIENHPSTRSEVNIPLKVRDRVIGVFNAQSTALDGFSPSQRHLLEALAAHLAVALENARLFHHERQEKERALGELDAARRVQLDLFPDRDPDFPGFRIEGSCLPCRDVAGDWYDYVPLPDGRLGVVLADVSGKGVGAALLMSSTRSLLRLLAEEGLAPSKVMARLNHKLVNDFPDSKFVTLVYGVLNPDDRSVTLVSAGHPAPILVTGGAPREVEIPPSLPLGIADAEYPDRRVVLRPGDRLLLFTDGATETVDPEGNEYGAMRLGRKAASKEISLRAILDDLAAFRRGAPAPDDVTLVLIESI
jgi:phosphoserine phosphatase RsbU/P